VEPEVEKGRGRCDQVVCLEAVVAKADCVRQTRQDPFVHASLARKSIGVLGEERLASMQGRDGKKIYWWTRLFSAPPRARFKIFFWKGA